MISFKSGEWVLGKVEKNWRIIHGFLATLASMKTTMKAAVHRVYGNETALQFEQVALRKLAGHEVLIRVKAATVNRTDCAYLTGKPAIMHLVAGIKTPRNPITGSDFAGIIEKVGEKVTQFKPGDRVVGLDTDQCSSHAEYVIFDHNRGIAKLPDALSFVEVVASMEGAHYAYNFIKRIPEISGKNILVNGATGAIGSAGLQFLKHHGATVTAVCRSEHDQLMKKLGADDVIYYDKEDFTHADAVFDMVFDAVGKSTFGKCRNIMSPRGLYISSELGPKAQNPFLALITRFSSGRRVKFPVPTNTKASMSYIFDRLQDRSFKPLIDREYAFEDIREAFRYVLQGQKVGNVVITYSR